VKSRAHGAKSNEESSRKAAKDAKFGENRKLFFFAGLMSWRDKLSALIGVNLRLSVLRMGEHMPEGHEKKYLR